VLELLHTFFKQGPQWLMVLRKLVLTVLLNPKLFMNAASFLGFFFPVLLSNCNFGRAEICHSSTRKWQEQGGSQGGLGCFFRR